MDFHVQLLLETNFPMSQLSQGIACYQIKEGLNKKDNSFAMKVIPFIRTFSPSF